MYANLVPELLIDDTKTYKEMVRMNYDCFSFSCLPFCKLMNVIFISRIKLAIRMH